MVKYCAYAIFVDIAEFPMDRRDGTAAESGGNILGRVESKDSEKRILGICIEKLNLGAACFLDRSRNIVGQLCEVAHDEAIKPFFKLFFPNSHSRSVPNCGSRAEVPKGQSAF